MGSGGHGRWACVRGRSLLGVPPADRDGHRLANDLLLGLNGGVKGAVTLVRCMTSGFRLGSLGPARESEAVQHHPGMGHAARYGQTMFTKQVSRAVYQLDPPSWPPRRSRSSELEERPAHGPDRRFLCPTG